ncbi:MAG: DJ-1/PfpI family protein [Candidatus Accumulibacter sp. UW20]|jgi:cyclohexyl-isocyanide hydratase
MDRREFHAAALAGVLAALSASARAAPQTQKPDPVHDMSEFPASWTRADRIAMVLYPGFTALDLVGPQYMFGNLMGATVDLVSETMAPVESDTKLSILPTRTFEDCSRVLDLLFVPGGGQGTLAAMSNERLIDFLADRGSRAGLVTSVCTGSLVLGQAGLLRGYRATSHWVALGLLGEFGATPVDARVVEDRNRITGAGVSAGLDMGLRVVARMRDREYAEAVQLLAEYAPQPPFNAGTPETAPAKLTAISEAMFTGLLEKMRAAAKHAR